MSKKPARQYPKRDMFQVKAQLVGKLGDDGFDQLFQKLEKVAVTPQRKRRRRPRRPKVVAA